MEKLVLSAMRIHWFGVGVAERQAASFRRKQWLAAWYEARWQRNEPYLERSSAQPKVSYSRSSWLFILIWYRWGLLVYICLHDTSTSISNYIPVYNCWATNLHDSVSIQVHVGVFWDGLTSNQPVFHRICDLSKKLKRRVCLRFPWGCKNPQKMVIVGQGEAKPFANVVVGTNNHKIKIQTSTIMQSREQCWLLIQHFFQSTIVLTCGQSFLKPTTFLSHDVFASACGTTLGFWW